MSNIYSYLTDEEREFLYENSVFEYEFARNLAMMEAAEKHFDLECMHIDLQILKENGTIEDMEEMYTEAQNVKEQKTGNAEGGIIESIKRFISGIFNRIGSIFKKGDPKVKVGLPDTPDNIISALDGAFNNVKNIVSGFFMKTNSDGTQELSKVKAILGGLSFVASVGGVCKFLKKNKKTGNTIEVPFSQLTAALSKLNQLKDNAVNWVSGLASKGGKSNKFAMVKELIQPFFNIITGFGGTISSAMNTVKDKASDTANVIGDKANKVANKVKGKASDAANAVGNTVNKVKDKLSVKKESGYEDDDEYLDDVTESSIDDLNGDFEPFYEYESFDVDTDELIAIIDGI